MTTEMRKAIRGRIAVIVLVTMGLAGLLAWQQATKPGAGRPLDIHWRLETVQGQRVHLNFEAVQRQAGNL